MPGNTADKTTLRRFIKQIEAQYGKAERTWVMDRGIPTEEVLAEMRASDTPICYLVGTPRGRLGKMEQPFLDQPWGKFATPFNASSWTRMASCTSWHAATRGATRNKRCGAAG
jgi:hypothetical protein